MVLLSESLRSAPTPAQISPVSRAPAPSRIAPIATDSVSISATGQQLSRRAAPLPNSGSIASNPPPSPAVAGGPAQPRDGSSGSPASGGTAAQGSQPSDSGPGVSGSGTSEDGSTPDPASGSTADRSGDRQRPQGQEQDGPQLTEAELRQVQELQLRDQEVRRHEMSHKAVAGELARGGITYEYQTGPDGRRYAVGGHVNIDVSTVPNDPAATIRKMSRVRRAALAVSEPSAADRAVAAKAAVEESRARMELQQKQAEARKAYGLDPLPDPTNRLIDAGAIGGQSFSAVA